MEPLPSMLNVPIRRFVPYLAAVALFSLLAACGGSSDPADVARGSLTDPASVPTSTRIAGEIVYTIDSGGISVEGASRTVTPGPDTPGVGTTYIVLSGDTCGRIAAQFEITVAQLRAENILINAECTNIIPDQILRIPGTVASNDPTPSGDGDENSHVVLAGQNCGDIATLNGITVAALLAANGMTEADCRSLQIGQVLQLPN